MKPEEKRLVDDLFHRLDADRRPVEDQQADSLIRDALAARPALAYRLVQHAVLQDVALREAKRRIADLEAHLQRGGGFLGRLLGDDQIPGPRTAGAGRRWDGADRAGASYPPERGGSASGGFLRSAATTAAGVAAGGLLLNGLERLFGGAGPGLGTRPEEVVQNDTVINEYLQPDAGAMDQGAGSDAGGWLQGGGDPLSVAGDPGGWAGDPFAGGDPGDWSGDASMGGDALLGDGGWDGFGLDGLGADDGDWT